jgi:hypothetical protein
MRAKTLNEIQNFERGNDPKSSMGIGKIAKIKKMLEGIYENNKFLQYNLKNPDHIEISYIRGQTREDSPDIWIMKYVEKDRFSLESESEEKSSFTHSFGTYNYWIIEELKFFSSMWPDDNKFKAEGILRLGKEDKTNEEKARIILKAFNAHYGKIGGFELIEYKKKNES